MTAYDTLFWFLVVMLGVVAFAIEAGLAVRHRTAVMTAMFSTVAALLYMMLGGGDASFGIRGSIPGFETSLPTITLPKIDLKVGDGAAVGVRGISAPTATVSAEKNLPTGPFADCDTCPSMVAVVAGRFVMGSPPIEKGRRDTEGPVDVTIKEPFAAGRYEVTRDQFAVFVDDTKYSMGGGCAVSGRSSQSANWRQPGFEQAGTHPVVCITWRDARAYVAWLTQKTKKTYRLLSESEWEFMARGGVTSMFTHGSMLGSTHANFNRGRDGTIPVGYTSANLLGIHDVHGNVWEMVEDCWNPDLGFNALDGRATVLRGDCSQHSIRGGGWDSTALQARLGARAAFDGAAAANTVGFRVARVFE